jgi:hypothetical protein
MLQQEIAIIGGESFSIGYERHLARTLDVGRLACLMARARSHSLDRALSAGADPATSPQLAARAAQLTSSGTRAAVADGLERLLNAARGPQRRWSALSHHRHQLLANAAGLQELATLLRGDTPLYARGIAILNQLLTDGTSAAYRGDDQALALQLGVARALAGSG